MLNYISKNYYITACLAPPTEKYVEYERIYSPVLGGLWTGANITYSCLPPRSFVWGENTTLTCGRNGQWSQDFAPRCVPGNTKLIDFLLLFIFNFFFRMPKNTSGTSVIRFSFTT